MGPEFEQGKWYEAESVHPHPEYYDSNDEKCLRGYLDIGLIKLKDQVKFDRQGNYYLNNLLCLPDINMTIKSGDQFALMSGWFKSTQSKGLGNKLA